MKKVRPIATRHGGKFYLADWIISHFPPHKVYCEPFLGGGSVLLNKPPALVEIGSDLDAGLMSAWRAIRDRPLGFQAALAKVEYCQEVFSEAVDVPCPGPVTALVRSRFSRGGLGKTFAWSERTRGGQPGDVNAWDTFRAVDLPRIAERVQGVEFLCEPAIDVIEGVATSDTLIYCDPPYLPSTRTTRNAYQYEMSSADHLELLDVLKATHAKVAISGYPSAIYEATLVDWRRVEKSMPNHSGQGKSKQRRTECLWMNY